MNEQTTVMNEILSSVVQTQDRISKVQKKLRAADDRQITTGFPSSSSSKENNRNTLNVHHDENEMVNLTHQVSIMQAELVLLRNKGRQQQRIQHDDQRSEVESLKQQLKQVRSELQIANESSREILRRYETEMKSMQNQLQLAIGANTELAKQVAAIEHEKETQQASLSDVKSSIVLLQFESEEYKMQYNELSDILRDLTW